MSVTSTHDFVAATALSIPGRAVVPARLIDPSLELLAGLIACCLNGDLGTARQAVAAVGQAGMAAQRLWAARKGIHA